MILFRLDELVNVIVTKIIIKSKIKFIRIDLIKIENLSVY